MLPDVHLRIDHAPDAGENRIRETHLRVDEATVEEHLDEQSRLECAVPREDFYDAWDNIDYLQDRFYLVVDDQLAFGGRLRDLERGGESVTMNIHSFEEDAKYAEPTEGALKYVNATDIDIVADAISRVPGLESGRLEAFDYEVGYLFSHASPAKMIRKTSESSGAEIRYNPDRTVDYVRRLGVDRSPTLSPLNQSVSTQFKAVEKANEPYTHILALGTGEGDHQIKTVVESSDFDASQREVWGKFKDKEIAEQDRLETVAQQRMAEYEQAPESIELDLDISGVGVELGDTFDVVYPREDIDTRLRVVDLETTLAAEGITYSATLSNRRLTNERPGAEQRQSAEQFQTAFEGNAVPISDSGGRQPVDPDNNYEMDIFYPSDVVYELSTTVNVQGLPYRAYSQGAASSGGIVETVSSTSNDDFESVVASGLGSQQADIWDTWTTIDTIEYSQDTHTSMVLAMMSLEIVSSTENSVAASVRLYNVNTGNYYPGSAGLFRDVRNSYARQFFFMDPTNLAGNRHEFQARVTAATVDGSLPVRMDWTTDLYAAGRHTHDIKLDLPDHTHDPEPGIIEYDRYPTDCDVLVNGESVGVSLGDGDGTFEEEVDIGGYLSEGFNDVEVTSTSLGHLNCTVSADVYRQITGE